jgi:condensin complex subunit 2
MSTTDLRAQLRSVVPLYAFQASCTLDASVKIYSNRVDDTYSSSHRILESLSRNGTSHADEGHDDVDDGGAEDGEAPEGGRKKTTKTSTRLNIATTIERNVSALNAVKLENDVAVDPMFHKISKAFDEGGAKGMLMNNLVSTLPQLPCQWRRRYRMAVGRS